LALDGAGNIFVADTGNFIIRQITPDGTVTTVAGKSGFQGTANGTGAAARFSNPLRVAVDNSGNVYVSDSLDCTNTIRRITSSGVVSTLAGRPGVWGQSRDGTGSTATFQSLNGLAIGNGGDLYVVDATTIRKVTASGMVTTIAGHGSVNTFDYGGYGVTYDYNGYIDGPGDLTRLASPTSIAYDSSGNLYVADGGSIRKGVPTSSLPPVVLGSPVISNGQLGFWIAGFAGSTVAVETSSDLVNWRMVGMYRLDGGKNLFVSPTPVGASQYYRARP
jgi:hypothetical protein